MASASSEASSAPQKKSAMAEIFFFFFTMETRTTKSLSRMVEEEVASYKVRDCIPVDADPLEWWKNNTHTFPHISKHNVTYLCQVKESSQLLGT